MGIALMHWHSIAIYALISLFVIVNLCTAQVAARRQMKFNRQNINNDDGGDLISHDGDDNNRFMNWSLPLRMPEVAHQRADTKWCHAVPLPQNRDAIIVGFEHFGPSGVVHHMLAYGCEDIEQTTWDCGHGMGVCRGKGSLMWAWAKDAPAFNFPDGVGFHVGPTVKYIVAEMHYGHASDTLDSSGINIMLTNRPQPFYAGLVVIVPYPRPFVPGLEDFTMDADCTWTPRDSITAFAYRVHTHSVGKRVYADLKPFRSPRVIALGDRDPQLAQSFVTMPRPQVITRNDKIDMHCVYDTRNTTNMHIGGGMHDEMCNFYIMAYSTTPFTSSICSGTHMQPI